jgi:hypothetical protein
MKATSLACRIGPKPNATASERVNAPVTFPATDAIAVALPQAIALAIMKRTLGPGAKIMIIAAIRYSGYLAGKSRIIGELSNTFA